MFHLRTRHSVSRVFHRHASAPPIYTMGVGHHGGSEDLMHPHLKLLMRARGPKMLEQCLSNA